MKIRKYICAGLIVTTLFLGACSRKNSNPPTVKQPTKSNAMSSTVQSLTNPPVVIISNDIPVNSMPAVASNANILAATNFDSEYEKNQKSQITKGQMMQAMWAADNQTPQSLYGKVVDQYGQPVGGADVTGSIELIQGFDVGEKFETYKTKTDFEGLFQFTGLKGARLDASVEKKGYQIDYRVGRSRSGEKETSPNDRAIFTMWKLKGVEPLVHEEKFYGVNPDGRVYTIDLLKGTKIESETVMGDLRVRIQRPLSIQSRAKFDWSFVITAIDGGFVEAKAGYLNEAPESGYQPQCEIQMSKSEPDWHEQIERTYYLKSRGGQVYGRIQFTVIPNYRDVSVFKFDSYVNPAGSRNLEFDPAKQIR